MKWFNANKTVGIDLDKTDGFVYSKYSSPTKLEVTISGHTWTFYNEEADEIYNMLMDKKDVI